MKYFVLISILIFANQYSIFSQLVNEKCINCLKNETNPEMVSSALGEKNISYGHASLAAGYKNLASGDYSMAFGYLTESTNGGSFSAGYSNTSSGIASVSLGSECISDGKAAFSCGLKAKAFGLSSLAIGSYIETGLSNTNTFVIGSGLNENFTLKNEMSNSLMIGFKSTVPTLFISASEAYNKSGKIGIGNVSSPQAKLHLKSDPAENATVFIEPSGQSNYAELWLANQDHKIVARPSDDMHFITQQGSGFVFSNGNIVQSEGYSIVTGMIEAGNSGMLKLFDNTSGITITNGGKVGIKSGNPTHQLTVNGNMLVDQDSYFNENINLTAGKEVRTNIVIAPDDAGISILNQSGEGLQINDDGDVNINGGLYQNGLAVEGSKWESSSGLIYYQDGPVGIGTIETGGYRLAVAGNVLAEEVMVQHADKWYDYIFDEEYELSSLADLESFIKKHKHLPDVPTEQMVREKGINLGEFSGVLLQKIEELTLYIIQQQREIESLKQSFSQSKSN